MVNLHKELNKLREILSGIRIENSIDDRYIRYIVYSNSANISDQQNSDVKTLFGKRFVNVRKEPAKMILITSYK